MQEEIINAVDELRLRDQPARARALSGFPPGQARLVFEQLEAPLNTLPVVDEGKHFKGLVTLSALVLAEPDRQISELMLDRVPAVNPETDQEEVARLIQASDLLAPPECPGSWPARPAPDFWWAPAWG